jgi:hypothetical protein
MSLLRRFFLRGSSKGVTTEGDVTSTDIDADTQALDVAVKNPIEITDGAGIVNTKQLGTPLTNADVGLIANTTIHGLSSGGGGTFVDVKVTPSGALTVEADVQHNLEDGNYPEPNVTVVGESKLNIDQFGNLRTRGEVLTDELSFRDDFSGVSLSADWIQDVSNGSINVASSKLTMGSGTLNASNPSIIYEADYGPITARFKLSLSQRIANQSFKIGFITRDLGIIQDAAYLEFSGTDNQKVNTVTYSSPDPTDSEVNTNITLPDALTTVTELYYKIDVSNNTVTFSVSENGQFYFPLSQHILHIPRPYDPLNFEISFENTSIVAGTNAVVDYVFINNMNRVQVDHDFGFEPLPTQLIGSIGENLKQIASTNTGALKVELAGNNISAFGDINFAPFEPLLQIDFVYGILTSIGSITVANGGTADTSAGRLRLQTGTNVAGSAIYQSVKVAKYRPGQGIDARWTWVYNTPATNSVQQAGMGDQTNAFFFGYSGTTFGIYYINAGVTTFIAQNTWNIDPCNGTGISRFQIDPTKGNVYKVKYPYLGYGDVTFFIQNPKDGQFQLVHIIRYANSSQATELSNPNLTFYARVANTGNNTNIIGYCGSVGVFLSGVRRFLGQTSFAYNNKALTAAGGTVSLFTVKNATTFNGVPNKSLIRINSVVLSVGNLGNNQFGYLFLLKNATVAGVPVFTPESGATADNGTTITNGQSPVSVDVAGTTVTGGQRVWASNGVNTSNAFIDVTSVDIFIAPGETLVFASLVTGNASVSAVANYVLDI